MAEPASFAKSYGTSEVIPAHKGLLVKLLGLRGMRVKDCGAEHKARESAHDPPSSTLWSCSSCVSCKKCFITFIFYKKEVMVVAINLRFIVTVPLFKFITN